MGFSRLFRILFRLLSKFLVFFHIISIPKHLALIMDGNRRWAAGHHLNRAEGHKRGYSTLREVCKFRNLLSSLPILAIALVP